MPKKNDKAPDLYMMYDRLRELSGTVTMYELSGPKPEPGSDTWVRIYYGEKMLRAEADRFKTLLDSTTSEVKQADGTPVMSGDTGVGITTETTHKQ